MKIILPFSVPGAWKALRRSCGDWYWVLTGFGGGGNPPRVPYVHPRPPIDLSWSIPFGRGDRVVYETDAQCREILRRLNLAMTDDKDIPNAPGANVGFSPPPRARPEPDPPKGCTPRLLHVKAPSGPGCVCGQLKHFGSGQVPDAEKYLAPLESAIPPRHKDTFKRDRLRTELADLTHDVEAILRRLRRVKDRL